MKFSAVRDFLAVAEQGGLRAAARHLEVAQPVISRSIRELEKELGVALFERHAKGVRLTPMGEAFARRAQTVRQELQKAKEEIDQLRGEVHGTVTVCLSSAPHLGLLPQALPDFQRRYPAVHLHVIDAVYPGAQALLLAGRADCYVGPLPPQLPRELQGETLFENQRVIMGRRGHPLGAARSLRELTQARWITTAITHKDEEELGPLFAQHGLPPPQLAMRAQSSLSFLVAMMNTDLLMMLPRQWEDFGLWQGVLQRIAVAEPLPAPPVGLVRRAGLPLTPAAEYFCDMVRRAAHHALAQSGPAAPLPG